MGEGPVRRRAHPMLLHFKVSERGSCLSSQRRCGKGCQLSSPFLFGDCPMTRAGRPPRVAVVGFTRSGPGHAVTAYSGSRVGRPAWRPCAATLSDRSSWYATVLQNLPRLSTAYCVKLVVTNRKASSTVEHGAVTAINHAVADQCIEPPRVSRRLMGVSHAALADSVS